MPEEKWWLKRGKNFMLAAALGLSISVAPVISGCGGQSSGIVSNDEEEVDDDDLFVFHGGKYHPMKSYNGPMSGAVIHRKIGDSYSLYTGPKHPPTWTANPKFSSKTSSSSGKTGSLGSGKSSLGTSAGGTSTSG